MVVAFAGISCVIPLQFSLVNRIRHYIRALKIANVDDTRLKECGEGACIGARADGTDTLPLTASRLTRSFVGSQRLPNMQTSSFR
jgi:hypothetical protein